MEHHSNDVTDSIEAKLQDSDMMDRVVRGAVADAVEKARRLGFLDDNSDIVVQHALSGGTKGKN